MPKNSRYVSHIAETSELRVSSVTYSVFVMHRRKELWGPDADEFDPDRFLDSRLHTYLTPNPYIFVPFNAGPRICLGQQVRGNDFSRRVLCSRAARRAFGVGVSRRPGARHTSPRMAVSSHPRGAILSAVTSAWAYVPLFRARDAQEEGSLGTGRYDSPPCAC